MNPSRIQLLKALRLYGKQKDIPNISPESEEILRDLLKKKRPKYVLEIGSANGISSIVIADCLEQWKGELWTCDRSEPTFLQAQENFQKANLHNIHSFFGVAPHILQKMPQETFDFIFLDAEKKRTLSFFEAIIPRLSKSGSVLLDDAGQFPEKMQSFFDFLEREKSTWKWHNIPAEEGDHMMLIQRR